MILILSIKILIIIALLKLLIETESPLLCASLFAVASVIFGAMLGGSLLAIVVGGFVGFGYAFCYFWLLARFIGTGLLWWLILVLGLVGPAFIDTGLGTVLR